MIVRHRNIPTWAVCAFMAGLLVAAHGPGVLVEGEYINLIGALVDAGARSGIEA